MSKPTESTNGQKLGQRVPPHNKTCEQSILSSILIDPTAIEICAGEGIVPTDFYLESHSQIYAAATSLLKHHEPVNAKTVAAELEGRKLLDRIGGPEYLASIEQFSITSANLDHFIRLLMDMSGRRNLITASGQVGTLPYDETRDFADIANEANKIVYEATERGQETGFVHIEVPVDQVWNEAQARLNPLYRGRGVPSGYPELDEKTGGLQPGDVVVVAGRPSMGKTSFALNYAAEAAIRQELPVGIFSLEMSRYELTERLLCAEAQIDSQRLRRGQLNEEELASLADAMGPVGSAPIYIDDTPALDEVRFMARALKIKRDHGVGLIVLDYIQLMHGPRSRADNNRVQEVSSISRTISRVSRELDLPIIAISQLSRAPEARADRRPVLSDLRESGEIEQNADLVLFLYRDEYYNPEGTTEPGVAEVILAKHRNGPVGTVKLRFRPRLTRFESLNNGPGVDYYVP